ncbi:hypothetical protein BGX26_006381, partial [Mortierella sp. AD094]
LLDEIYVTNRNDSSFRDIDAHQLTLYHASILDEAKFLVKSEVESKYEMRLLEMSTKLQSRSKVRL